VAGALTRHSAPTLAGFPPNTVLIHTVDVSGVQMTRDSSGTDSPPANAGRNKDETKVSSGHFQTFASWIVPVLTINVRFQAILKGKMKGKATGFLCLLGFAVLRLRPDLHDELNLLVEQQFRRIWSLFRGTGAQREDRRLNLQEKDSTRMPEESPSTGNSRKVKTGRKPWKKAKATAGGKRSNGQPSAQR